MHYVIESELFSFTQLTNGTEMTELRSECFNKKPTAQKSKILQVSLLVKLFNPSFIVHGYLETICTLHGSLLGNLIITVTCKSKTGISSS